MTPRRQTLGVLLALILSACASPIKPVTGAAEVVLPLHRAWVDGKQVEYVTTDISDLKMARDAGVNHVPRLRDALARPGARSVVERVYKFTDNSQITVFQSAPQPTGAENKDASYSPLWRMVLVQWRDAKRAKELRSEEEVLAAVDRDELSLEVTDIVVNCPITRSTDGQPLRGVR